MALLALVTSAPSLASTVWHVGDGPSGRPTTLELVVQPDGATSGRRVDLCGAHAALDRRCDPGALRAQVLRELRAQDAAWAVAGELDASTPWLLDPFTIGPSGVRLDDAPYAMGPYAQGPFAVEIPFDRVHELSRGRGASDP